MKKVAIQGYKGCFHEQAARLFYSPSVTPSDAPSVTPSDAPSVTPSITPSVTPSVTPSDAPSVTPSDAPSVTPSGAPSVTPLGAPSCHSERSEESISIVECDTFEDLFRANADAIVMAIENTVSGGLLHNFELLRKKAVPVKGEVYIRIGQNLMANPGQTLQEIKEVRTHYMAINQTRPWFESNAPWIKLTESEDTAKSAAQLAASGERGVGAVAGELAAQLYGLEILAPGIETNKQNFTRFLVMDNSLEVPEDQINKAILCFTLPHKPGSLAQILTILSFYDMNLTRIQSLPIPGRQWQYFFYADIKFEDYTRYTLALQAVRPLIEDFQILGEYKSAL